MSEDNPHRIDDEHRNGINEFLTELTPSGAFDEMVECLFDNWALVVDRDAMVNGATARRLGVLRAERDRQDEERADLDAEITRLEGR